MGEESREQGEQERSRGLGTSSGGGGAEEEEEEEEEEKEAWGWVVRAAPGVGSVWTLVLRHWWSFVFSLGPPRSLRREWAPRSRMDLRIT